MRTSFAVRSSAPLVVLACLVACEERSAEPLRSLAPKPLPAISLDMQDAGAEVERERLHQVTPAEVFGEEVPDQALTLEVDEARVRAGGATLPLEAPDFAQKLQPLVARKAVLVKASAEVYVAQLAPALAVLDDHAAKVWLQPPGKEGVAYPVRLEDEPAFRSWLDEVEPGKIRVIQRADGFELQTNVGKLPGPDRNGPTVPRRGGRLDVTTLRHGLQALRARFTSAKDVCLVPSFGTEMAELAAGLTGLYEDDDEPIFEELCLVYPRPTR